MSGYRTNKEWLAKQAAIRQGTRDPLREDPAIDAGSEGMTEFSEQLQRDAAALRADLLMGAVVDRAGALERYSWEAHYLDEVLAELCQPPAPGSFVAPITLEVLAPLLPPGSGGGLGLTVEDVAAVTGRSAEEVEDAIRRISTPTPSAREAAERLGIKIDPDGLAVMTPQQVRTELVKQYEEFVERDWVDPDVVVDADGMDVRVMATVPIAGDITVVEPLSEDERARMLEDYGTKPQEHEAAVIIRWRDVEPGGPTLGELVGELDQHIKSRIPSGGLLGLRLPLAPAILDFDAGDDDEDRDGSADKLVVDFFLAAMAKAGSQGQHPDRIGVALACMVGLAEELLELREVAVEAPQEVKPIAELFHAHRRQLVEALGYNDADSIYLWEDLLAAVRRLVAIADAAVAGLKKPDSEFFGPWAQRVVEARVARLQGYEAQLERAFGGDRWMTYADPIRLLEEDTRPSLSTETQALAESMEALRRRWTELGAHAEDAEAIGQLLASPSALVALAQELRGDAPLRDHGWRIGDRYVRDDVVGVVVDVVPVGPDGD